MKWDALSHVNFTMGPSARHFNPDPLREAPGATGEDLLLLMLCSFIVSVAKVSKLVSVAIVVVKSRVLLTETVGGLSSAVMADG